MHILKKVSIININGVWDVVDRDEYDEMGRLFSAEEQDAFNGIIPMTQKLFNRCIDKCLGNDVDGILFALMDAYPDFLVEYGKILEMRFGKLE